MKQALRMAAMLAVAFCSGFSPKIAAQTSESGTDDDEVAEIIVRAIRIEGAARGRRTVASRDDLDLTDQTSMQGFFDGIDGLSTLGGDNEGNAFSIDGLSPDLGKVTLDGQSLIEGRGNGGIGPGDLSPDMIFRVDLYKTPAASREEGGAAGIVNLRMRNPVDIPKPTNSIRAKLNYVPDDDDFSPSVGIFTGRPWGNRKFGYMLSVNLSDREKRADNQDITSWELRDFDGTSSYYPRQVRNNVVANDQSDIFAGLTMGFRPSQSLDISSNIFLSRKEKGTDNLGLHHRIERQRDISALAFGDRIVTALDSSDDSRANLRVAGATRADQVDSMILSADFRWRRETWRMDGAVGYSVVDNQSDKPSQNIYFAANSAMAYESAADGTLPMSYSGAFPATQEFVANGISLSLNDTEDTGSYGGIDVVRQMGDGVIRRFRIGGKIRETTRSRYNSRGEVSLDDLLLSESDTGTTQQTTWDTVAWPTIDMAGVDSLVREAQVDWEANLLNEYAVEQQSYAGYVQADFRAGLTEERFLIGNFGARFVDTRTRSDGFQDLGEGLVPVSVKKGYSDFLPSLNARTRITERTNLSFGVARVMVRPELNDLAPGIRVNFSEKTAKSGNPDLQPFRANMYLAELAWTTERGPQLGANITFRDVSNFTALGEEEIEIADDTYLVTRPINGGDGTILSATAKAKQDLQNFSAAISYTHNRSRTDFVDPSSGEVLPMPNTAEHVVKASLIYGKELFTGRLRYNWRGRSLKSSFSESGLSVWNQPVGSLDLNLAWQLRRNLRLNFDAKNLFEDEKIQTTDHSGQLERINEQDTVLSVTLRAKW